ncbi:MAG: HAMP domain-containing sensor histidine kinase [Lapillicoccus sp.]
MRTRLRPTLATRIALLAVSVALLTSIAGGVISVNLLQRASEQTARSALSALADQAQATAEGGVSADVAQARARKALQSINVQIAVLRTRPDGSPALAGDTLASRSLTTEQIQRVVGGETLSLRLPRPDGILLVEARPTPAGGLVLAQRRGDAVALGGAALRDLTILLVITGVVAVLLGLLVAWRLARPLKRTAAAATALAQGSRDVAIPETGPREVAEVAASVNRLAGALSHSEARQREFLLSVSHDLRTPLTAITGYAESLADGVVPPERLASVGAVIGDEARRLERLVADLLDLARLDAQEMRMRPAPVDLRAVVDGAAETWRYRCDQVGVPFRTEVADDPVVAFVDAQRLRQALDGLLENALRVTPQGAPVVVAARREPGDVAVLEVRDGGPGLTDDDLPVAFERSALYERYRGVRQVGTGLGLAIVHRIVERLGGTVEAGHATEGGARFTIRLPLLSPPPGQNPTAS